MTYGGGRAKRAGRSEIEEALDDQELHFRSGDRRLVEEYLRTHPALREHTDAVLDLIYHEILLRRELGETPTAEEYVGRFPTFSEDLVRQFAADDVMRTASDLTMAGPQSTDDGNGAGAGRADLGPVGRLGAIEGYELLSVLGRGGMGVVYKARDLKLGRIVAIKMIAEANDASPQHLGRFRAEAELVARLQHPNIIQVHGVGEHQGCPYFSLEFVGGGSLADRLAEGPMAPRQTASLVETLAHAASAAHRAGIVHRDLKPSNVLLTADGVPKISDFGLAKLLGADSVRTLSGETLGTPSYMAPEQAEGRSREVGPAADIYALGAILYQALTGRPPFLGASAIETLKLVVSTEVIPPRRLRPAVPRDLETICLKCLEKDPRKRYSSALDLAADLERFGDGRPIVARPVGALGRGCRYARRNPTLSVALAGLILTFALGTPSLFGLWVRASAERDRAERAANRALCAVRLLVQTGNDPSLPEEARSFSRALVSAGLKETQALLEELKADPRAEYQRVEAYGALAELQFSDGDHGGALQSHRTAISLAEALVASDPASIRNRYNLAGCLQRLTGAWPPVDEYLSAAWRSTEICQDLCTQHPSADQHDWIRMIAMNHFNVGNLHYVSGRKLDALESLSQARTAFQRSLDRGDRIPETLEFTARCETFLCRLNSELGRVDDALDDGRKASDRYRQLIAADPDESDYPVRLSRSESEVGQMALAYDRWDLAITSYSTARNLLKEAIARPGQSQSRLAALQEALAVADHNLRDAYNSDRARYRAERKLLEREGFEICDKISLVKPLSPNMRIAYAHCCFSIADDEEEDGATPDLALYRKAERLLAELVAQDPRHDENRGYLVYVQRRLAEEQKAARRIRGRSNLAISLAGDGPASVPGLLPGRARLRPAARGDRSLTPTAGRRGPRAASPALGRRHDRDAARGGRRGLQRHQTAAQRPGVRARSIEP